MSNEPPVVAVEMGTSRIRALVGEVRDGGQCMITGLGECPSRGVRKGEIVHVETAETCLRSALQQAEENGHVHIHQVHLVVTGGHIDSLVNRGSVPVMDPDHEVLEEDVEHAMEHARSVGLSADRRVLHTICQHYYVDDQEGVPDPVGMEGAKLSVDMLVIHGLLNRMRNLVRVVLGAQVEVEDVAFSGLCAALAVLTREDKENGVVMVDLGGGTTDFVAYARGVIADAGCFAVGGDHVSNDIARGLHLSVAEAEHLKETEGGVLVDLAARSQKVVLGGEAGQAARAVKLADLNTIIHARMDETLRLVRDRMEAKGLLHALGGGVVLTGGGARTKDLLPLAEKVFGLPSRIGCPVGLAGLAVVAESPQFAAPAGMVKYAFRTRPPEKGLGSAIKKLFQSWFGS
ncbi:MAG TPA: cell division protein FtsA [Kiritimatiellia bacterium]|nr:cell division protein FtsA [Kiritimatiellia bacterium]HRZ11914.1 cell division protein FtsA [Kiritimatiellia bacterium]HSA17280.1 cell division protein FtsA [Kiritimatiellia bacterium]